MHWLSFLSHHPLRDEGPGTGISRLVSGGSVDSRRYNRRAKQARSLGLSCRPDDGAKQKQPLLGFSFQVLTTRLFSLELSWLVFLSLPVAMIREISDVGGSRDAKSRGASCFRGRGRKWWARVRLFPLKTKRLGTGTSTGAPNMKPNHLQGWGIVTLAPHLTSNVLF